MSSQFFSTESLVFDFGKTRPSSCPAVVLKSSGCSGNGEHEAVDRIAPGFVGGQRGAPWSLVWAIVTTAPAGGCRAPPRGALRPLWGPSPRRAQRWGLWQRGAPTPHPDAAAGGAAGSSQRLSLSGLTFYNLFYSFT